MNKTISTLKLLIGWPLSIVALGFLIKLTIPKFSLVQEKIYSANLIFIFLAVILFIIYFLLRSFLWKMILDYKGYKILFKKTAYLWGFSEFKRYIPGNIWSFLSRVSLFADTGIDKKIVGLALLDEIQLIVVSSTVISIFALPLILSATGGQTVELLLGSLVGIIIYGVVIGYIYKKRTKQGTFLTNIYLPGYSLNQKITLTFISVFTFFVFGFATFIACLSITNFSLSMTLILSSFFTFALLVGYLSFITPMGLGVREGVVTIGLSSIVSVSTAGFLSIFSRIIMIISEVSFLILVLLWDKLIKTNSIK